ncbi:MAG TPA: WGR domain-containing protein [Blastocatellia bacterium]|nr:WGR domain-containing protein [Blastocatellia bacterium]
MTSTVREAIYIYADVAGNNNKFWNIQELSDNSCSIQWGRVGSIGQTRVKSFASPLQAASFFEYKCRQKETKGYRRLKVLTGSGVVVTPAPNREVAAIATKQIETDSPQTLELVNRLADANVHNILSSTQLVYDTSKGTFSTPLGIITEDAISEARTLLGQMADYIGRREFTSKNYIALLNSYLRLVPQKVGRKIDPQSLYPDLEAIRKQNEILDSLEASLKLVVDKPVGAAQPNELKLFEARLKIVEDCSLIDRIRRFYQSTRQAIHASHNLGVNLVYEVEIKSMKEAFESFGRKLGNVMELWHGTRVSNLLSILKSGFVIPPSNAPHCTGRMFGNGVYFSDQSTKSLNYSFGYWGGRQDQKCFMLLNDVAMGRFFVPKIWSQVYPKKRYHSTFAKAGWSGVLNNEMVVYDTKQINPKYLVEFSQQGR